MTLIYQLVMLAHKGLKIPGFILETSRTDWFAGHDVL
jgi:hypothetical protein